MALFETVVLLDTRANQPVANAVGVGTLFSVTDEANKLERSNGVSWDNFGPTVAASTTGNAATATALQTARTINGVSFNGTANITVPAAAGTLTGATLAVNVLASSLTSVGVLATLTVTAPIVGSVTGASGSTTGNAATATLAAAATVLATPRNINGVSFDGSADITVPAAAGTLTGATLAAGVLASSLTSVGVLTGGSTGAGFTVALSVATVTGSLADARLSANVPLLNAANNFTAVQTITKDATGVVQTDGLVLQNTTLATAVITAQNPPVWRFKGNLWNSTAVAANNTSEWFIGAVLGPGAVPNSLLRFFHSLNGAAATVPLQVLNTGLVTIGGAAQTTLRLQTGEFKFDLGGGYLGTLAANQYNFSNSAGTVGFGIDISTDAVMKVRTRAQTGDAAVKAAYYTSSTVSTLTVTTNTIAPTALIHHLGAGLIKTITVPTLMASPGFIMIIPDAAFTYDATGNIVVPAGGGTATINRVMLFVWDGTKWIPNY